MVKSTMHDMLVLHMNAAFVTYPSQIANSDKNAPFRSVDWSRRFHSSADLCSCWKRLNRLARSALLSCAALLWPYTASGYSMMTTSLSAADLFSSLSTKRIGVSATEASLAALISDGAILPLAYLTPNSLSTSQMCTLAIASADAKNRGEFLFLCVEHRSPCHIEPPSQRRTSCSRLQRLSTSQSLRDLVH